MLSFIVYVQNHKKVVDKCVNAIFPQIELYADEVIIVDNNSQDGLQPTFFPNHCVYMNSEENLNPIELINDAVNQASNDVVVLLDAFSVINDDYVFTLKQYLIENKLLNTEKSFVINSQIINSKREKANQFNNIAFQGFIFNKFNYSEFDVTLSRKKSIDFLFNYLLEMNLIPTYLPELKISYDTSKSFSGLTNFDILTEQFEVKQFYLDEIKNKLVCDLDIKSWNLCINKNEEYNIDKLKMLCFLNQNKIKGNYDQNFNLDTFDYNEESEKVNFLLFKDCDEIKNERIESMIKIREGRQNIIKPPKKAKESSKKPVKQAKPVSYDKNSPKVLTWMLEGGD